MKPVCQILIVEDEPESRVNLREFLTSEGYGAVIAATGEEGLEQMEQNDIDLILLDISLPGMNGYEVCKSLRQDSRFQLVPIIFVTGLNSFDDRLKGIDSGGNEFLSKPINLIEMSHRIKSLLHFKQLTDRLDSAEEVIFTLANAVEARDSYTGHHTQRVSEYSYKIGKKLGLDSEELDALRIGGVVHDIGKISIPDEILRSEKRLTPEQKSIMMEHPKIGFEICKPLKATKGLLDLILHHHEKLDGTGYPGGLKKNEIPLSVRIITMMDIFDALSSSRTYRKMFNKTQTLEIIEKEVENNRLDGDVFCCLKGLVMAES